MTKRPFTLTPYQVQWIMLVGFASVGIALYVRYLGIELPKTALACDAGLPTLLCQMRSLANVLHRQEVFGIAAIVVAVLHLIRPSIVLLTAGVAAAGLGLVLFNTTLAGIAAAMLILGFARPAPAT
jgi:hypothetical protein